MVPGARPQEQVFLRQSAGQLVPLVLTARPGASLVGTGEPTATGTTTTGDVSAPGPGQENRPPAAACRKSAVATDTNPGVSGIRLRTWTML